MRKWICLFLILLLVNCNKSNFSGKDMIGTDPDDEPANPVDPKEPIDPENPAAPPPENPNLPKCTDQVSVRGAHFLFLVDNSGSMKETDCPNLALGRCGSITAREKSILRAFDELQSTAKDKASMSTVSITRFTPYENGDVSYATMSKDILKPTETTKANRANIASSLAFTRLPKGDTPYLNAMDGGKDLLTRVNTLYAADKKPRAAVLVTDGEPTDRNPGLVSQKAAALKKIGVKLYTIMVGTGSVANRTAAHHDRMEIYEYIYKPWRDKTLYPDFDVYVETLMAVPYKISDTVIKVSSSDQLEKIISEEIIQKTTGCVP